MILSWISAHSGTSSTERGHRPDRTSRFTRHWQTTWPRSAQLQGDGDISDSVAEVNNHVLLHGSHKTESFPLASDHASGGYTIARAEYAGGDTGNATHAESDAGC
jgi:hypothetical protein